MPSYVTGSSDLPWSGSIPFPAAGEGITSAGIGHTARSLADRTAFLSASLFVLEKNQAIHQTLTALSATNYPSSFGTPQSIKATGSDVAVGDNAGIIIIGKAANNWSSYTFDAGTNVFTIDYLNNVGWIGGGATSILKHSPDGGTTWVSGNLAGGAFGSNSIRAIKTSVTGGIAVCNTGKILVNNDVPSSGTWEQASAGGGYVNNFRSVATDGTNWILCGEQDGLQKTTEPLNGSSTVFTVKTTGTSGKNFVDVAYGNGTFLAIANDGIVIKSVDGGDTWAAAATLTGEPSSAKIRYISSYDIWLITTVLPTVHISKNDFTTEEQFYITGLDEWDLCDVADSKYIYYTNTDSGQHQIYRALIV
jgi:hypothetical protein